VRFCIKLVRIGGINIKLHLSWFFLAALLTLSFANHFRIAMPGWGGASVWGSALAVSLLFLSCLVLHELAHSLMAKHWGLEVDAITLFVMGGVTQMKSEPPDAKSDFWIAAVGPLTSIALGVFCLGVLWTTGEQLMSEPHAPFPVILLWLGWVNLSLAAFNLLPSYPLDGGRILRAIIWWINGNAERSKRMAAKIGLLTAVLLLMLGIFSFMLNQSLDGLWLVFLGWILFDTSRGIYTALRLMEHLGDRRVSELMDHNYTVVESYISLVDFAEKYLAGNNGRQHFVVVQDSKPVGFITRKDVKKVLPYLWPQTSVQSIMHSFDRFHAIMPETLARQALEIMSQNNISQLPVMANGKLEGIFSRPDISQIEESEDFSAHESKRSI
jgi:Zn-dependent protease/predicted transcriptional regulator